MKEATTGREVASDSAGNAEVIVANTAHLAERINALHHEVEQHKAQMLLKARDAGLLLLEAKDTVKHGEWLDWLDVNFADSGRTARAYMRIAQRWDKLEAKWQSTANLSITQALKLVRYGQGKRGHA